jgi:hypothetical protein
LETWRNQQLTRPPGHGVSINYFEHLSSPRDTTDGTMRETLRWTACLIVFSHVLIGGCSKSQSLIGDASIEATYPSSDGSLDRQDDADVPVTAGPDADPPLPADLMAPAPPDVACADDGSSAACDLPPSVCAEPLGCDAGAGACASSWIVYYQSPRCVDGRCVWVQGYFQCSNRSPCQNGACTPPGTTLP